MCREALLQIIRDLVDNAISVTRAKLKRQEAVKIAEGVENRIVDALCGDDSAPETKACHHTMPCPFTLTTAV